MSEWEITPTAHQKKTLKMNAEDILTFTQVRVAKLLHEDAFCDDGKNVDVSVYIMKFLPGRSFQ